MNRKTMCNVARMGYVPGNVKFLDANGKFHNFGSACGRDGIFRFNENREDETPMPRHHLCSMLELEEGDDPQCGSDSVMIMTYNKHGKTTLREITGFYMDGTDLIFTESPTMKKYQKDSNFEQALEELPDEYSLEEDCWLKASDVREFLAKLKAAHESDMDALWDKFIAKVQDLQMQSFQNNMDVLNKIIAPLMEGKAVTNG